MDFQEKNPDRNSFHIITFEQAAYAMNQDEIIDTKKSLQRHGIYWYPNQYHTGGRLMIFKKVYDFISAYLTSVKLKRKYNIEDILGFTSIAAGIAFVLSKLLRLRLLVLNMEPHSDYMLDFGYWKKSSIKYRLLKYLEQKVIRNADELGVPTKNYLNELSNEKLKGNLHFIPTCIDTKDFDFLEEERDSVRQLIGAGNDDIVVVYLGKFGGIYYSFEEVANTYASMLKNEPRLYFYVITPDDIDSVKHQFQKYGLTDRSYVQGRINYSDLSKYLSGADMGIMLVPSYPTQKFRCPIKTANYLACGLPYIITDGIGDDSDLARDRKVGMVLSDNIKIADFRAEKITLQQFAEESRGLHLMNKWLGKVYPA